MRGVARALFAAWGQTALPSATSTVLIPPVYSDHRLSAKRTGTPPYPVVGEPVAAVAERTHVNKLVTE
jgi:hypothetical protein